MFISLIRNAYSSKKCRFLNEKCRKRAKNEVFFSRKRESGYNSILVNYLIVNNIPLLYHHPCPLILPKRRKKNDCHLSQLSRLGQSNPTPLSPFTSKFSRKTAILFLYDIHFLNVVKVISRSGSVLQDHFHLIRACMRWLM